MDDLVSIAIVVEAVLFSSGTQKVVLDGFRMPDRRLVLDGVEDLVDWKPQRSELFH